MSDLEAKAEAKEREYHAEKNALKMELRGGVVLTVDEAQDALNEAMTIIETVGTTGVHHKVQDAGRWMKRYYPNWA